MEAKHTPSLLALLPCPFCGGEAEIVHIEDGENAGGSCVSCMRCMASSNVEFEFKENFVSNWNRRETDQGWREALVAIAQMADPDDPESYRSDDREGCLDAVHATALEAISKATGAAQ